MTGHDVERAYVQSRLDHYDHALDRARESMHTELDHLRESWSSGTDQQLAEHEQRMAQLAADQAAWLASFYDDGEPAPAPDVQSQARGGASAGGSPASPAGPAPDSGHPLTLEDVRAAELAEADRIKGLDLATYAQERQRLIRANSAHGLFG